MLVGQIAKIKVGLWLDCLDKGWSLVGLPRSRLVFGWISKIKVGLLLDCQDQGWCLVEFPGSRLVFDWIAKIKVDVWLNFQDQGWSFVGLHHKGCWLARLPWYRLVFGLSDFWCPWQGLLATYIISKFVSHHCFGIPCSYLFHRFWHRSAWS